MSGAPKALQWTQMRQLLLLRHAKSDPGAANQADHARPLNPRGRQDAATLRTTLRTLGLVPDVVLVSSARRTLQTLDALAPWDETPLIEPMNGLYLATAPQILRVIAGVAETVRSLMVVAHNPGLHDLAMTLAASSAMSSNGNIISAVTEGFPTSALAEFTVPGGWAELATADGEAGTRLVRFLRPPAMPQEPP
jgi:phosphohistidine phosphatase